MSLVIGTTLVRSITYMYLSVQQVYYVDAVTGLQLFRNSNLIKAMQGTT